MKGIIIREVGAYGLWEAVSPHGFFICGGFSRQDVEYRARLIFKKPKWKRHPKW